MTGLQESEFLNYCLKEKPDVIVWLIGGGRCDGVLTAIGENTITLRSGTDFEPEDVLIYKHALKLISFGVQKTGMTIHTKRNQKGLICQLEPTLLSACPGHPLTLTIWRNVCSTATRSFCAAMTASTSL